MGLLADRRVPGDWFDAPVPEGVEVHDEAYLASAFSFCGTRGRVRFARGSHVYAGSTFDVGPHGRVEVGTCSMINGAYVLCEQLVEIGSFATISWNVVFMDNYRMPLSPEARRRVMIARAASTQAPCADVSSAPVRLCDNVWIGFDACVLPGVTIGEGSVVGARSVVTTDVPAYTVVAGNPAKAIRSLPRPEGDLPSLAIDSGGESSLP